MTSSQQPMDDAGRKRHLEALFADEPFLSPTMKARRMHEKMYEMRARESHSGDRPYGVALAPRPPYASTLLDEPDFVRSDHALTAAKRMSFVEAAARLRRLADNDNYTQSPSDSIGQFRTQLLAQWVQRVGPRETSQGTPTDRPVSPASRDAGHHMDDNQR